jgi:hypothetical protein
MMATWVVPECSCLAGTGQLPGGPVACLEEHETAHAIDIQVDC